MFWYVEMNCNNASINRSFFTTLLLKFHICGAVIIAEGTGSEVNTRVDRPLALVVLALPRVCLLPSLFFFHRRFRFIYFFSIDGPERSPWNYVMDGEN